MIGIDGLAPWDKQRPLELNNVGSADIPRFGIAEITNSTRPDSGDALVSGGGRTVLSVQRPGANYVLDFAINGPIACPPSTPGIFGTQHFPCFVAYNPAQTPAFGEEWGITANSSLIVKNRPGLLILGDPNGEIVRVSRTLTTELIVKGPSGGIGKGSSGVCAVWMRSAATGAWEPSEYTLTCTALGAAIPSGTKYGSAAYRCGQWVVAPWECAS